LITVLVVEDADSERELICDYLRQGGYSVISACDGTEGFEKFEKSNPNVVVTDLMMPGMSGLELCRAIKKSLTGAVPVIACQNQPISPALWLSSSLFLRACNTPKVYLTELHPCQPCRNILRNKLLPVLQ
jgi:twitching motility two-component system response regulator PilH